MVKTAMLPGPKSRHPDDERSYCAKLARATSGKDWYNDAGTLGKPLSHPPSMPSSYPRYVWFTDELRLKVETAKDKGGGTEATKARDALGLIDTRDNTYLLSLLFPAEQLHAIPGLKMARPGFSDMGNSRFAIYLGKGGQPAYSNNWGFTAHLGKIGGRGTRKIGGVPERICSPIQLTQIGNSLNIRPLGWVIGSRGMDAGVDDDAVFIAALRGRSTLGSIKRNLMTLANQP